MIKKIAATTLLIISPHFHAYADDTASDGLWADVKNTLSETWNSSDHELYVPVNTWHNRAFYDKEKIDGYNEHPWGIGFGKYRYDADGDWHGIYAMVFADSHKEMEPVAGYAFQKMWHANNDFRLGAGYTVGLTLREDYNYLPIPIIAPIASIEYKQLAVQSTYIPGGQGNGNILFTWLKWQIK